MSCHWLARISRGTDNIADVIHHAVRTICKSKTHGSILNTLLLLFFLSFIKKCGMKLTVQDVAYSLELLSGIHAG